MQVADYIKNELPYWPTWINFILLKMNIFGALVYGRGYRKFIKNIEQGNPEEKLIDMVNHAISNVPYYRKRYSGLRIQSLADFEEKISFIDKDEVMSNWNDFLVDNIDWSKVHTGTTGGTSGKPLKLVEPANRYIHSLAFTHKQWMWFGWKYDTRGVFRNHHIEKGRDYIISPILKEIIFDTFRMDEEYAQTCWKTLKKYHVHYIHAYPSSFYQFCKLCTRQGLALDFIKTAFLASEGVTDEQDAFFKELGITIYSFYGHSEKLILAGNHPNDSDYHIEENYGYCELVDDKGKCIKEHGVLGEMVGTTFCNPYFPLIRYRTGDYSHYTDCSSMLHKTRFLGTILGRWDKCLIYKFDGTTTSITALNLHDDLYSHIDGLQYIQEDIGKLIVCIIKNKNFSIEDENTLIEHYAKAMGGKEYIEIRYVKGLKFQANGKFLQLLSKIQ